MSGPMEQAAQDTTTVITILAALPPKENGSRKLEGRRWANGVHYDRTGTLDRLGRTHWGHWTRAGTYSGSERLLAEQYERTCDRYDMEVLERTDEQVSI